VALIVPTFIVIGTILFGWGLFRSMWETRRDRIIGGLLVCLSMASFGVGWWGLASVFH
jgi:hypothetical protein